jgi:anti-sigma factor RsiW
MHLTAERIQAFLDAALSSEESAAVREHATFCGDCQTELDSWRLLYSELSELPELSPAPGFATRVLTALDPAVLKAETEKPLFGRLRQWAARTAEHVEPERLQDYVEGLLPSRQMARVSAHVKACEACRSEELRWEELIHGLECLPELAPSEAFSGRVMAQLAIGDLVRTPAPSATRQWVLGWAERLIPRTQKAWAVISGVALTPVTVVALLAHAVFSNPLVTPGHLASFLWWKVTGGVSALAGIFADGVLESPLVFYAYSVLGALANAPVLTAMVAVSLAAATSLSGWVLYRNLMTTRTVDGNYATASI